MPFVLQSGEHLVEIGARHFRVDASERIVGAKLQDHGIGFRIERPVEPREPVGRRVARNARIDDGDLVSLRLKRHLKLRGERIQLGFDAIAGGKTIPESNNRRRSRLSGHCGRSYGSGHAAAKASHEAECRLRNPASAGRCGNNGHRSFFGPTHHAIHELT